MPDTAPHWFNVFRSHFLLCTFVGMVLLRIIREPAEKFRESVTELTVPEFLVASAFTGGLVALATWIVHRLLIHRILRRYFADLDRRRWAREGAITGFVCGALAPLFQIAPFLIPVLAGLFLVLIFSHARLFIRRVAVVLRPGNHPQPADVARLVLLYISLIACFTLLNMAIAHLHPSDSPAYRGLHEAALIDSLYFAVVVITTLGFGDITPLTPDAKIAVVIQVVTAYVLFALLIGTITRGVASKAEPGDD